MHSSRAVLRDRVGRTSSPNRSAKIRRRQCCTSQTNRRVITRRRTCLPALGRSATCRWYRLWIRRDLAPHKGHSAIPASDPTAKIIESDESLTLSITNPLGTNDEIRIPARMALIPSLGHRKLGLLGWETEPTLEAEKAHPHPTSGSPCPCRPSRRERAAHPPRGAALGTRSGPRGS